MKRIFKYGLVLFFCMCFAGNVNAQSVLDTLKLDANPGIVVYAIDTNHIRQLTLSPLRRRLNALVKNMKSEKIIEYVNERDILNERIATYFMPYEGKIIRNIIYRQFDFNIDFSDTTRRIDYFGTKILSALHTTSREWVIRQNMFVKEKEVLNPFVLADNERYLRNLQFIRDARIIVDMQHPESDSLDLYVITKDLFGLNIEAKEVTDKRQHVTVGESNLFGTGQAISITALRDIERKPKTGANVQYTINNLLGTFLSATINAGNIHKNRYDETYNLTDYSLRLERPLFSQYSNYIGDITIGKQRTYNTYPDYYNKPDRPKEVYIGYSQNYFDAALGYNINAKKYILDNKMPDRNVIMMRYMNNHFDNPPDLQGRFSDSLSDRSALLLQYTYFKQYFYKTSYILGFGATEDMPYGINASITAGYQRQLHIKRPYVGLDINNYTFTRRSDMLQYFLRAGSYYDREKFFQDLNFIGGISVYSRLFQLNHIKYRQKIQASYAQQVNPHTSEPLRINNLFGLNYFREDSVMGEKRLSLRGESIFFMPGKVMGFAFAPFLTFDAAVLDLSRHTIWHDHLYYAIGGGVRTRNENLQFGTIELRLNYFPKKIARENQIKIMLITNLRFRYNSNYVSRPRFVEYNSDIYNNIY